MACLHLGRLISPSMKGFTLLSAVALTTMALTGVAFAQKAVSAPTLTEEGVRTVTFTGRPTIH